MASGDDLGTIHCNAFEDRVGASGELTSRGNGDFLHKLPMSPDAGTHGFWFKYVVPGNYDGGGFTLTGRFMAETATTGNVVTRWRISNRAAADVDSAPSFGTATTETDAVPGTSGILGTISAAISHANAGSPSPGDELLIEMVRLGDDGSDTASGGLQWDHFDIAET